ncbi:MAG: 16S rRNA (guanine(966)-N(2))-methyltransferase RsmD [Pseudomonadota bacterium]
MRIVAGHLRGRVITPPESKGTRPTSDKTRETLFNILQHADWAPPLENAAILDLYAGSGALALEALSRGAASAVLIDMAQSARRAMRENVDRLGVSDRTEILKRDVTRLGACPETHPSGFDLILCDPPYRKGLAQRALETISSGDWLAPHGVVALETAADEEIEDAGWHRHAQRKIGPAMLWFLGRS